MVVYGWAVLSTSFGWLTGGRGLHTVHKCVVFHQFYIVAWLYCIIACRVRVGIYYRDRHVTGMVIWNGFHHTTCSYVGFYHPKIWGIFHNAISGTIKVLDCFIVWLCMDGRSYLRHWDYWQVGMACTRSTNVLFFTTFTL